jgi:endo-1,4-beta-D-glucanase Y
VRQLGLVCAVAAAAVLAAVALATSGSAPDASERFLDRYMDSGGRVVRHDQGGDTVSEGQAYAMLLAAADGDRKRFDAAWSWARVHLQRRDGLLSWHWKQGRVLDRQPATDADLDAAWALAVAARRFHRPAYRRAGARIARGVLAYETAPIAGKVVLVAGPWARAGGTVNPSYFSPRAYAELARIAPDPRWARLEADSRRMLSRLPTPPPDWARMDVSGIHATAGYGFDAFRAPVRYAASCARADRQLAARWWPEVRDANPHPSALAGAAAAARAAGDRAASDALLDRAEAAEEAHSTYYGAAWVALARTLLQGDALGACPG